MPNYKDLYFKLLRAQSKAIEQLTAAAQEAEESIISEEAYAPPLSVSPIPEREQE